MILVNRLNMVSVSKKSFKYVYLNWGNKDSFKMNKWHEPLHKEGGQRPLGPTILVEWEE